MNSRKGYLGVAKRVFRYLKGTIQMGFFFGQVSAIEQLLQNLPSYNLIGYIDSKFGGDLKD